MVIAKRTFRFLPLPLLVIAGLWSSASLSQEDQRWFQIELSVFSNEREADRNEELLSAERTRLDYPARLNRLQTLIDLLMIPELLDSGSETSEDDSETLMTEDGGTELSTAEVAAEPSATEIRAEIIATTGPFPPDGGDTYSFPDFERDAFVQLPAEDSDFQQTNRALERSTEHRLLFHGLWRQPMPDPGNETPLLVLGGQQFGEHHELQGSLSLHFNSGRDRVVIDADLWLAEFVSFQAEESEWSLPEIPATTPLLPTATPEPIETDVEGSPTGESNTDFVVSRVYHMEQSRDMRSNEFHYLDHPAMGIVVTVFPYEVPPLPEEAIEEDVED